MKRNNFIDQIVFLKKKNERRNVDCSLTKFDCRERRSKERRFYLREEGGRRI